MLNFRGTARLFEAKLAPYRDLADHQNFDLGSSTFVLELDVFSK